MVLDLNNLPSLSVEHFDVSSVIDDMNSLRSKVDNLSKALSSQTNLEKALCSLNTKLDSKLDSTLNNTSEHGSTEKSNSAICTYTDLTLVKKSIA